MKVEVNGIQLFYETKGQGPPLILLHGNGEDHHIFDESADRLAKKWTVFLPDSRGHGNSSRIREFHYRDMAEDIIGMIEELRIKEPCLYGFSDGGIIGLLIAIKRPELLSGLIISGANLNPRGMKRFPFWLYCAAWFFSRNPKLRLMLTEPDIRNSELARIPIPVWVTAGEHDVIRKNHTEQIAAAIPVSGLRIVRKETHSSYVLRGSVFLPVIQEGLCFVSQRETPHSRKSGHPGSAEKAAKPPERRDTGQG